MIQLKKGGVINRGTIIDLEQLYKLFGELLPHDVVGHIARIQASVRLQRSFRKFQYRHAQKKIWPLVLQNLAHSLESSELDELSSNAQVRREWRMEPDSWRCTNAVPVILLEVREGMWRQ